MSHVVRPWSYYARGEPPKEPYLPLLVFLTRVNDSFATSSLLYKVKGQIWIADRDLAIKVKGRVFNVLNHTVLSFGKLAQEGGSSWNHTIPELGTLLKGKGLLIRKPFYSLPWWTYTGGAYWGNQTTSASSVSLQGKEVHLTIEPYYSWAWWTHTRGRFTWGTILLPLLA